MKVVRFNDRLWFGKYKGVRICDVIKQDPAHIHKLMDEGKIAWVMAPSVSGEGMDRLAVSAEIMEDLQLKQGQTVNSILRDAILMMTLENLGAKISAIREKKEEEKLTEDFDFRNMMGDDNDNDDL